MLILFFCNIFVFVQREGPNVRINQLDENECSPLMYAVLADSIPAIEVLLHCGAKREEVHFNYNPENTPSKKINVLC